MRTIGIRLALLLVANSLLLGCGRAQVFTAKGIDAHGIRVEVLKVVAKKNRVSLRMVAYSELATEVVIDRNQVAVVGPDGRSHYRYGGRNLHKLRPYGSHKVYLDVDMGNLNAAESSGYYVRMDGVYVGSERITLPPLVIGIPASGPGDRNANLRAPEIKTKRHKPTIIRTDSGEYRESNAIAEYQGPRSMIKKGGIKVAVMPLKAMEISKELAFVVDELVLTELQNAGFEAIGPEDINALVGFESVRDAVGCNDASCMVEIGNALGVPYLVAGSIASLDGSTVMTLKLIDVVNTRVVARVNKVDQGGRREIPRVVANTVGSLVRKSKL